MPSPDRQGRVLLKLHVDEIQGWRPRPSRHERGVVVVDAEVAGFVQRRPAAEGEGLPAAPSGELIALAARGLEARPSGLDLLAGTDRELAAVVLVLAED